MVNARSGRWIVPAGDAAKVNVDGGILSQGEKGVAAAVTRDKNGHFLGASVVLIAGLVNPASLEAHACSEALALTQDLNLQRLVVASDCLELITNLKNGAMPSYASVLEDIHISRRNFTHVDFCFKHRESNFEAHSLAKGVASLSVGRHLWLGILPDVACIPFVLNLE